MTAKTKVVLTPAAEVRRQYQRGIVPATIRATGGKDLLAVSRVLRHGVVNVEDGQGWSPDKLWQPGTFEVVEWTQKLL